jgi:hypothetical protein
MQEPTCTWNTVQGHKALVTENLPRSAYCDLIGFLNLPSAAANTPEADKDKLKIRRSSIPHVMDHFQTRSLVQIFTGEFIFSFRQAVTARPLSDNIQIWRENSPSSQFDPQQTCGN